MLSELWKQLWGEMFERSAKIVKHRLTLIVFACLVIVLWIISSTRDVRHLAGKACIGDIQIMPESQTVIAYDGDWNELPGTCYIEAGDTIKAIGFAPRNDMADEAYRQIVVEAKSQRGTFWFLMLEEEFVRASNDYWYYQYCRQRIALMIKEFYQALDSSAIVSNP